MSKRARAAVILACALGSLSLGLAPAHAAPANPTVALTGKLIRLADQTGSGLAAIRTADRDLVPVQAAPLAHLESGGTVTLAIVVPATVRSLAAASRTLTVRRPDGTTTSTPLDPGDLSAAGAGTPAPATSDLGRATAASAVSTGRPLTVSAVVAASDPVGSYTPATRRLFVAVVTPKGSTPANSVTQDQIRAQVASTSGYWSTVSGGGVTMSVASITAPYTSAYACSSPWNLWSEAADRTGFTSAPNTSLVVELARNASDCGYGLGTMGGNVNDDGMLYVSDTAFPVLAHELGHNMSLEHANTLECPSASDSAHTGSGWTATGCTEDEYGDGTDVMAASGRSSAPFLSSPQSLRTGILPTSARTVPPAGSTTTVTLNALGSRSGVRLAQVTDPVTDVTYYVEYRVATAPDTANVYGEAVGVRVLRFNPATGTTVLLDPTPSPDPTADRNAALGVGVTFTSYGGAVRVTTVSTTPGTATISVSSGISPPAATAGGFTGRPPTRVLDTRKGLGAPTATLGAAATLTLTIPGLPAGTTAVALNVTATNPTATGYLTVYPGGATRPTASNLNFLAGQTIPNLVLVPVGPANTVTFYNSAGTVNIIADLVGTYAP